MGVDKGQFVRMARPPLASLEAREFLPIQPGSNVAPSGDLRNVSVTQIDDRVETRPGTAVYVYLGSLPGCENCF